MSNLLKKYWSVAFTLQFTSGEIQCEWNPESLSAHAVASQRGLKPAIWWIWSQCGSCTIWTLCFIFTSKWGTVCITVLHHHLTHFDTSILQCMDDFQSWFCLLTTSQEHRHLGKALETSVPNIAEYQATLLCSGRNSCLIQYGLQSRSFFFVQVH